MPGTLLDEARALKRRATALRNRGELRRALQTLDSVLEALRSQFSDDEHLTAEAREARAELADTHGMKGGILRRLGEADAALEAYRAGAEIENAENLSTTYNRGNVIALSITDKGIGPIDPELRNQLARVVARLEADVKGPRKDEWWAWADLAQSFLLQGEPERARACYGEALGKTGATREEVRRHVTILRELAARTSASAPGISAGISAVADELR